MNSFEKSSFSNHLLTFDYLHIDVLCISTIIPFITHNVYILILFLGIVGDIFIFI
jgi:predicted membrane channel-forming protein YqfA (hemolysin III family)